MRRRAILGVGLVGCIVASRAQAYPTSVVFAPTAESRPLGKVGGFAYGATIIAPRPRSFTVSPWFAVQGGVLPPIPLGGGYEMGGAEVGFDVLGPGDGTYKPVLNGKLGLLKQRGWAPGIGVGMMQVAPTQMGRGLNMAYLSLTEAISVDGTNLGSFTVGWGQSFAQRPAAGNEPVFHGTVPFAFDDRSVPILGYASPSVAGFSFGIEHISGYSEMSGTTGGIFFAPARWVFFAAGGVLANDRSDAYRADMLFSLVGFELELVRPQKQATPFAPPRTGFDPKANQARVP
jgi:hypothetical protein